MTAKYSDLKSELRNEFSYTDNLLLLFQEKLEYEIRYSFNKGYEDAVLHTDEENFWHEEYEKNFAEMCRQEEYTLWLDEYFDFSITNFSNFIL